MNRMTSRLAGGMLLLTLAVAPVLAADQWQGVDDAVVKKIAREHGREARPSLLDFGEGDMQLFMFLLAGAVGGFVAGYCWRALTEGKQRRKE